MRIVIATPFYPPQTGVLADYAAGIERGLKRAGHTVTIVSFNRALPPGIRHIHFFLQSFVAMCDADAALALDTWSVGFPAFLAARIARVPFAVRIGGDFLWETYLERTKESIRLSDFYTAPRGLSLKEHLIKAGTSHMLKSAHVLFTTHFQEKIWKEAYTIPSKNIAHVENYIPPVKLCEGSGKVIVSAGRSIGLKKHAHLARIITRLQAKHPTLTLDTRFLSRTEHLKRLESSYAVVVPSVSEVCSNTAIDALSHGKPFIMTDDTGTSERFGECGIFVDTRSEEALAQSIESLLDEGAYQQCRERIKSFSFTHSWDDIAREIVTVFA